MLLPESKLNLWLITVDVLSSSVEPVLVIPIPDVTTESLYLCRSFEVTPDTALAISE